MAQKDYDIEKLLEIAGSTPDKPVKVRKPTDVERYVKKFQIESGDTFVPNFVIYHHYFQSKQRDRMTRRGFFKIFARYYEGKTSREVRGYMLNPEPFDMSQEAYFKARAHLRREKNGKKEKDKKK